MAAAKGDLAVEITEQSPRQWIVIELDGLFVLCGSFFVESLRFQRLTELPAGVVKERIHPHGLAQLRDRFIKTSGVSEDRSSVIFVGLARVLT